MSRLLPADVDIVISHYPCCDGFTSRLVCYIFMNKYYPTKSVTYINGYHNSTLPDLEQFQDKNVLICDFSYRKDFLLKMISVVKNLLIIDHHKSAEKDLADIDDHYKIFDMNCSGAYLTWKYFFPTDPVPLLIQYVQDRDIWTKKLPNTDCFASWFYTLPFDEKIYSEYLDDQKLLDGIEKQGKSYYELNNYYTNESASYSSPKFSKIGNQYYFVTYVNTSVLKSDIGSAIFQKYPLSDFSVTYSINDWTNSTSFSLRSTNDRVDVSTIAFSFGGGGHRNASGVKLNLVTNSLPSAVYDTGRFYFNLEKIYFDHLEMDSQTYCIVYMNSSVHKTKFGRYLLQNKYNNIQVCRTIESITKEKDLNSQRVIIAAIWDYDGSKDVTDFSIVLDSTVEKDQTFIDKLTSNFGLSFDKGLRYQGFFNKLNFNMTPILINTTDIED